MLSLAGSRPLFGNSGASARSTRTASAQCPLRHNTNIRVELANEELWRKFYVEENEMKVGKHGREMFPTLQLKISGLLPDNNYSLGAIFANTDSTHYRFSTESRSWVALYDSGRMLADQIFEHPGSPARGDSWTSALISFQKLRISNHSSTTSDHVICLKTSRKYRIEVKVVKLNCSECSSCHVYKVELPLCEFIVVTRYKNRVIADLKITYNPNCAPFRRDSRKRKQNTSSNTSINPKTENDLQMHDGAGSNFEPTMSSHSLSLSSTDEASSQESLLSDEGAQSATFARETVPSEPQTATVAKYEISFQPQPTSLYSSIVPSLAQPMPLNISIMPSPPRPASLPRPLSFPSLQPPISSRYFSPSEPQLASSRRYVTPSQPQPATLNGPMVSLEPQSASLTASVINDVIPGIEIPPIGRELPSFPEHQGLPRSQLDNSGYRAPNVGNCTSQDYNRNRNNEKESNPPLRYDEFVSPAFESSEWQRLYR